MRICLIFFLLLQFAFSQGVLNVKEEDGDPSVHGVWQWEVSNGSLTDNNSGKITVKTANASSYYVGVAASDAANKELYDYVCDGVNDEVQINAAIDDAEAAPGGLGGLVQLSDGGFVIDAPISITTGLIHLKGQGGYNTRLTMGNSANCDLIVYDSEVQNLTPLIIEDMYFHGNTANNTSGRAFYDSQGTYPIQDVWIIRCAFFYFDDEVLSFSHKGAKVFQCVFEYNDEEAILFNTGGNDHQVTNCLFASNQKESIIIGSAVTLCKIIGNHISMGLSGTPAMAIDGAGNIVTGNTFRDNSSGSNQAAGIEMRDEADKCIISNNIFLEGDNHMTPAIDCLAGAEHSEIKDNKFIFSNDNPTYATVAENNFMGILNRQGGGDYWVRKDNNDFMIGDGTNYMQITDTGDFTSYGTGDYLVFGDRFAFRYALDEDLGLYFEDDVAGGALETKSLEGVTSTSINFTTGLFSTLTGFDGIGAVGLTYGSADITGHDFVLGSSAGNDFTVAATGIVVEGDTTNVGFGTATPGSTDQLHILMDASKDILIDGSTNPREIDTGVMRFEQKPAIVNTRAVTVNLDVNSQATSHAQVFNITATGLAAGETSTGIDINVDRSTSTGGIVRGYSMSTAGSGSAGAHLIHADPGVVPLSQFSGSFVNVEQAWDENGGFTDTTAAFNSSGTNVVLFDANGDMVHIGMDAAFNQIEVNLDTFAGGAGIKPTFHYSSGGGTPVWTAFSPNDDTQGFRQNGIIDWDIADLTSPTFAVATINAVSKFYIRITRTRVSIPTDPIEETIQVQITTDYSWDATGNLNVNSVVVDSNVQSASGTLLLGGTGNTNNENLTLDFETTSNVVHLASTSAAATISSEVSIRFNDWYSFYWGTGYDARMYWADSTYDSLQLGTGVGSNGQTGYFFFIEKADLGEANRYPTATTADPTFRIYSSDENVATDYIEFSHDQTDGNIDVGGGKLNTNAVLNAVGGFEDNGSAGVDGWFDDGTNFRVTVSGGIITAIDASSGGGRG